MANTHASVAVALDELRTLEARRIHEEDEATRRAREAETRRAREANERAKAERDAEELRERERGESLRRAEDNEALQQIERLRRELAAVQADRERIQLEALAGTSSSRPSSRRGWMVFSGFAAAGWVLFGALMSLRPATEPVPVPAAFPSSTNPVSSSAGGPVAPLPGPSSSTPQALPLEPGAGRPSEVVAVESPSAGEGRPVHKGRGARGGAGSRGAAATAATRPDTDGLGILADDSSDPTAGLEESTNLPRRRR